MVCLDTEGAMQIEGGNWQIFDAMIKASNATLLLNNAVNGITKRNGKYNIKSSSQDAVFGEKYTGEELFDTVVLAAPLQYSDIDFEKDLLKRTPDKIPYVTLHVTLFTSSRTLNPTFFNLKANGEVPTTILTTLPPNEAPKDPGFFSISTLRSVVNPKTQEKEHLYKIFSPQQLTAEFLSGILGWPSLCPKLLNSC